MTRKTVRLWRTIPSTTTILYVLVVYSANQYRGRCYVSTGSPLRCSQFLLLLVGVFNFTVSQILPGVNASNDMSQSDQQSRSQSRFKSTSLDVGTTLPESIASSARDLDYRSRADLSIYQTWARSCVSFGYVSLRT